MKLLFQRSTSHEPPKDKLRGSTELVLPRWRLHGGEVSLNSSLLAKNQVSQLCQGNDQVSD